MIAVNDMENTDAQKILGAIGALTATVQVLVDDREYVHGAITELTEGIHSLADHMDERFAQIDQRFDRMDQRFERMEGKIRTMDSQMVTKDYLDKKLANFHADTVSLIKRAISPSV